MLSRSKRKILPWKLERREWYNKEWRDKKRKLRRTLRNMKKERLKRKNMFKEKENIGSGVKNRRKDMKRRKRQR